jgi:hypothetical protein
MSASGPVTALGSLPPPSRLESLRRNLRRKTRQLYKSLRHPRERRKSALREWLGARINNRDLWQFRRHPVANGFAGGLFFSMLPLPMQSIFAVAAGIGRGWNLPFAIAATWISNPFTYVPMFLAARGSVVGLYSLFGAEPAIRQLTPEAVKNLDWKGFLNLAGHAGPELLLGYVLTGLGCALTGFVLVHSLWWLVRSYEDKILPPRRLRSLRKCSAPK